MIFILSHIKKIYNLYKENFENIFKLLDKNNYNSKLLKLKIF